jgi:hypothetical protein
MIMIKYILLTIATILFFHCKEIEEIDTYISKLSASFTIRYKDQSTKEIYKNPMGQYFYTGNGIATGLNEEQGRGVFDRFQALYKDFKQQKTSHHNNANNN